MSISLQLEKVPELQGVIARKVIIPKSKVPDFIKCDKVFLAGLTILSGSTVFSLCYQPSKPAKTNHKATVVPTTTTNPVTVDPTVVFVPLRLIALKDLCYGQFAPTAELDTVCMIFNERLFPKQADGNRKPITWYGKGLCHVSDGKVQRYGLGVVWKGPPNSQVSSTASRRASSTSNASTNLRTRARRISGNSEVSAQGRRASVVSTQSTSSSPASSRRNSNSSMLSNVSASSLALRPARLSQVTFSVKRCGLIRDLHLGCCDDECDPEQARPTVVCPQCSCLIGYHGDLAFQVTAHDARGQMLDLKPLVAEQALDDAFDAGLDAMLKSHRLEVDAALDGKGLIKGIKPRTCKWVIDERQETPDRR